MLFANLTQNERFNIGQSVLHLRPQPLDTQHTTNSDCPVTHQLPNDKLNYFM